MHIAYTSYIKYTIHVHIVHIVHIVYDEPYALYVMLHDLCIMLVVFILNMNTYVLSINVL